LKESVPGDLSVIVFPRFWPWKTIFTLADLMVADSKQV